MAKWDNHGILAVATASKPLLLLLNNSSNYTDVFFLSAKSVS